MLAARKLGSLILWGPPGCGKTTIARLLAEADRPAFRAAVGGVLRRRRPAPHLRGRAPAPPRRQGHAAVRRRDPSLQPRPAGRLPALRRGRHGDPGRRHDREPVVRAQRRAAVALPGAGAAAARRCRARPAAGARRGRAGQEAAARRAGPAGAVRHGRRRRPLPDHAGRAACRAQGEGAGAAGAAGDAAAEARAALRQGAGSPLQPDQRPAQVAARLGRRCGALLVRAHAGRRRGPAIHRPPAGALRRRGYRHGRSQGADPDAGGMGHLRPAGLARGRAGDRPGGDLSRHRAQIERRLRRPSAPPSGRPRSTAR